MCTVNDVRILGAKITKAIKEAKDPIVSVMSFGLFLAKVLEERDFQILDAIEVTFGEDRANRWLCRVMVRSGRYRLGLNGMVEVIQ